MAQKNWYSTARSGGRFVRFNKLHFAVWVTLIAGGVVYLAASQPTASKLDLASSSGSTALTNPVHSIPSGSTPPTGTNASDGNNASSKDAVSVTVNGESLNIPADGEFHKDISDENGSTSVDISHDTSGSGSSSSLNVELHSTSSTSAGGSMSE